MTHAYLSLHSHIHTQAIANSRTLYEAIEVDLQTRTPQNPPHGKVKRVIGWCESPLFCSRHVCMCAGLQRVFTCEQALIAYNISSFACAQGFGRTWQV